MLTRARAERSAPTSPPPAKTARPPPPPSATEVPLKSAGEQPADKTLNHQLMSLLGPVAFANVVVGGKHRGIDHQDKLPTIIPLVTSREGLYVHLRARRLATGGQRPLDDGSVRRRVWGGHAPTAHRPKGGAALENGL